MAGGIIRLRRRRGQYRDFLRVYRVCIDGNLAGKIAQDQTMDFPVATGEHRVRLTIVNEPYRSREVVLQVREGELAEFTCRPGAIPILFAGLVPHRYIRLGKPVVISVDSDA
jgi:hypothetical protein